MLIKLLCNLTLGLSLCYETKHFLHKTRDIFALYLYNIFTEKFIGSHYPD